MKRLQIFRKGKHTAVSGDTIEFTEADLQAAVAAYDPKLHEAPITVGHPKDNLPAYGWIKGLSFVEGAVEAEPDQVDPAFAELVNAGRFKKISASWYAPTAKTNPKPGVYYLRHVGFLGATPPAVKGLRDASFADGEEGVVTLEFADWQDMNVARMFRGLRDWILAKFGQDEADKALPNWPIEDALVSAAQAPNPPPQFSEQEHPQMKPEDIKAAQDKLDADKAQLANDRAAFEQQQAQFAERQTAEQRAAQRKAHTEFTDDLVKAGKLLPAQKDGLVAFMCGVSADGVVEFGEGDKAVKKPSVTWLQEFLQGLPVQVDFQERGKGGELPDTDDAEALAKAALEFQESERKVGRVITIADAMTHVTKEQK